jgi:hypothetical protein
MTESTHRDFLAGRRNRTRAPTQPVRCRMQRFWHVQNCLARNKNIQQRTHSRVAFAEVIRISKCESRCIMSV